jgi:hypothetical protein
LEISRFTKSAATASLALLASAALAACSGGGGAPAAPVAAPGAGNAFAAPDSAFQSNGVPAGYGVTLDDDGNEIAAAACKAPPPDPVSSTITLTGAAETVHVPCYKDFNATSAVPANDGKGFTVKLEVSTDKTLGGVANAKYGTPIVYTSLTPSKSINFDKKPAALLTVVASPSQIVAPHIYAAQVYVPAFGAAIQSVANLKVVPNTHEIRFNIAPPGSSFPAIEAVVIVYRQK